MCIRDRTNTDLPSALKNADLAIEAATENEAVKINIFKTMDQHAPDNCILATKDVYKRQIQYTHFSKL